MMAFLLHQKRPRTRGLTLIELMMVVVIVGILAALAAPSFVRELELRRLESATEAVYQVLRQARVAALRTSADTFVMLDTGATWNAWVSPVNPCTTRAPSGACLLDGIKATASDYPSSQISDATLSTIRVTYRTGAYQNPNNQIDTPQTITLSTSSGLKLRVEATISGGIKICTPNGSTPRYPAC